MLYKRRVKVLEGERNIEEDMDTELANNFQIFSLNEKTHIGEKFNPSSLSTPKISYLSAINLGKKQSIVDKKKTSLKKKFVKIYHTILTKTPISYKCFSNGKNFKIIFLANDLFEFAYSKNLPYERWRELIKIFINSKKQALKNFEIKNYSKRNSRF